MNPDKPPKHSTFRLRLPKSVRDAAKQFAGQEGVSLNHFISLAVAEKITRVKQSTSPTVTHPGRRKADFHGPAPRQGELARDIWRNHTYATAREEGRRNGMRMLSPQFTTVRNMISTASRPNVTGRAP